MKSIPSSSNGSLSRSASLGIALVFSMAANSFAQSSETAYVSLPSLEVNADRSVQPESFQNSNSGAVLTGLDLNGARIAIDDLSETIARYPGYAAFRKTPSRAAHPTTQGVRLRNLGISGASRSLVTLDGVPQNDPFGGWVYWQRYQPLNLDSVEIRPSSGSEAWGNFGTGGSIALRSLGPGESRIHTKTTLGTDGETLGSFSGNALLNAETSINLSAQLGENDGFHTVRPDQRGSIDRKADSSHFAYQGQLRYNPTESWRFTVKADTYEEDRNNGTPQAFNGSEATDLSASALHLFDDKRSGWQLIAYTQERDFHNQFTSVSDDRSSETPALDQFDMPSEARGANLNFFTRFANENELLIGADIREVEGEINERFRNMGSGFTRLRKAGGEQTTAGVFATANIALTESSWLVATARVDEVDNARGFRKEWNTDTDALILNQTFSDSKERYFSNNVTLYHDFTSNVRGLLRHTSGFRAPTLNELYRPFRVKNDIMEANPELDTEQHQGLEAGIRFGNDANSISANAFYYDLKDMIANVVLTRQPGFNPLVGFIPAGGSGGQRRNIPESEVHGLELAWRARLSDTFSVNTQLVYAQSEITTADAYPELTGNEFPHSAPFRTTITLDWKPMETLNAWSSLRYQKDEYEDLENQMTLDSSTQVDCGISYALTQEHALSLRVDNLFDKEIETGIASSGLVSISVPRTLWISWDYSR